MGPFCGSISFFSIKFKIYEVTHWSYRSDSCAAVKDWTRLRLFIEDGSLQSAKLRYQKFDNLFS